MSLKTWKEEFYPVPASKVPEDQAVAHSLQKWIGLRKENLKKHGCWISPAYPRTVIDSAGGEEMRINAVSCALCHHYNNDDDRQMRLLSQADELKCESCPLKLLRGVPCDEETEEELDQGKYVDPYHVFTIKLNPEPMIQLLEQALLEKKTCT